jgi:glycosyltransferase involved in cell wall biosynthesis
MASNPKILIIHNDIRPYREIPFRLLSKKYCVKFFITNPKFRSRIPDLDVISNLGWISFIKNLINSEIIITGDFCYFHTIIACLLGCFFQKKIIIFTETWNYPRSAIYKFSFFIHKVCANSANAIVFPGKRTKEYLIDYLKVNQSKLFKAPNTAIVKKNYNYKLPDKLNKIFNSKFTVLYMGRIVAYKGLDTILRAIKILEKKYPDIFLLYGSTGNFHRYIKELIEELNISNVYYFGKWGIREKYQLFSNADVVVMASTFRNNDVEQWGLVVNEAMSSKVAVICSDRVGSCPDLIKSKQTGLIFKAEDFKDLAEKIEILYINSDYKDDIAQQGYNLVMKNHNYQKFIQGFINAIEFVK